ncbi:hypothetical protein F5884DRAFT_151839 [Xylogone sp. PMI_703]|nr:hypothetical protein F5884DRAFT_151839 [Xylogone sp. PMI_703]
MNRLEATFNHLVLPPKLPGRADSDSESIKTDILDRLIRACNTISKSSPVDFGAEFAHTWDSVLKSLSTCAQLNSGEHLEKESLVEIFGKLQPGHQLTLDVVEQNAALLIRRHVRNGSDTVIFEAFETSPTSESVLAAGNNLQWDFPGCAVEIGIEEFLQGSFKESLATFLEKASMESFHRFSAHQTKANASVIESRGTADPAVITQMLMPLLEAVGSPVKVSKLRKRVRDDVNIQNAELPWRRLPFWLILRVSVERQLCLSLGNENGRAYYKFLICIVLAQFLEQCAGKLTPELTMLLKAKLCRRLAKLELDKTGSASEIYCRLFGSFRPLFEGIIRKVVNQIDVAWNNFKRKSTRPIPRLPRKAYDQDLYLSLPNSGKYLLDLLHTPHWQQRRIAGLAAPSLSIGTTKTVKSFTDRYFKLAELDEAIAAESLSTIPNISTCEAKCLKIARSISEIFSMIDDVSNSNPEEMSIFILNIFSLWVQMDICITKLCPLLKYYHSGFDPELLDALHLPTLAMMERLQSIQEYLERRRRDSQFPHLTILSELHKDCFPVKYVEHSTDLHNLLDQIMDASTHSRIKKETEWNRACAEYDDLTKKISNGTCVCSINPDGTRNVNGCKKCFFGRRRRRMKIGIHEDYLPQKEIAKALVVFELAAPNYLSVYRNTTWKIISILGHPSRPNASSPPAMTLKDYSQLRRFQKSDICGISIASAKKSFLQTHYNKLKMKVDLSSILLPLGLEFSYFDIASNTWVKDLDRPLTFQHLCGIYIPRGIQQSIHPPEDHPSATYNGPSSYEIVASQTKCPADMSVHEFMAYQKLISGKSRRWVDLLVELGSSNLNFSSEDTMLVVSQLAVQAGPMGEGADTLRDAHVVFTDVQFCKRLIEQIEKRLDNILSNWRERYCMDMLITLSLRLYELAPWKLFAHTLLKKARDATLKWISHLRNEVRNATDAEAAERAAGYGFSAALLCRRTFATFIGAKTIMNKEDLCSFVKASLALQENLVGDVKKLSQVTRNMFARDIKMAYHLKFRIMESIQLHQQGLSTAIEETWSGNTDSTQRSYSLWQYDPSGDDKWMMATITSTIHTLKVTRTLQYNILEGHLLIDGKAMGVLPANIRELEDVRELFGNQHLTTYPSSLTGMTHVLANPIHNHEVHFGVRGEDVIITALTQDGPLRYVPSRVFSNGDSFDLPLELTDNCVHWLNLHNGLLHIRRKDTKWWNKRSDWTIDVHNHRARRNRVFLVDPQSSLFKKIASIFRHFEDPQRLTVFQPISGPLHVQLRYLDLSFYVYSGLLYCEELQSEIDPNQDAGTLYGFESKIVLRDAINPERRSLIASLGNLTYTRWGMHVGVRAIRSGQYGKFEIDNVLGRLSCPPEPRLLYSKALFHALTSFVLPDPLTGRTGTEEALHILKSGYCQPWMPISDSIIFILKTIKALSPIREYYPKDKLHLQSVSWNEHLTTTIQHESYETATQDILDKVVRLRMFALQHGQETEYGTSTPAQLRRRAETRRGIYERDNSSLFQIAVKDTIYNSRDAQLTQRQASNVFQIAKLFRERPFKFHINRKLVNILQSWDLIGGFHDVFDWFVSSLNDLFESKLAENWGSLINACRKSNSENQYKLIFQLCFLAFGSTNKRDMDPIKILVAIACLEELKELKPPPYSSFAGYRFDEDLTLEATEAIITPEGPILPPKQRPQGMKALKEDAYTKLYDAEYKRLARFLFEQWPNSHPSIEEFDSVVIYPKPAFKTLLPEWHRLYQNKKLSEYINQVEKILQNYEFKADPVTTRPASRERNSGHPQVSAYSYVIPSLCRDLLVKSCVHLQDDHFSGNKLLYNKSTRNTQSLPNSHNDTTRHRGLPKEAVELERILLRYSNSGDAIRQYYGDDLMKSLKALKNVSAPSHTGNGPLYVEVLDHSIKKVRGSIKEQLNAISKAFSANEDRFLWLKLGNLWPSTTPTAVLELLRSISDNKFGKNMKENLVSYGTLITTLQRFLRLKHNQLKENFSKTVEELKNPGHENWNPMDFPDWLLLEIECNILIRPEQVVVANAILSPRSGYNSVLQMNMGKGKSSCIMPMAAAVLANKKQLPRLIVPKALLLQTAQTLQSRLGGLIGREIRHIPFSRRTPTNTDSLKLYSELHREILYTSGVIITTPENILSYKLSGLQRLADSQLDEARYMANFQSWLTEVSRDILDESDYTLAVKTQLIYPNGPQLSVDGYPHRWQIAQMLLSFVEDHLPSLQRDYPTSIEVVHRPQGFPILHFLRDDVENALHFKIIGDICAGRAQFLQLIDNPPNVAREQIRQVLTKIDVSENFIKEVSKYFSNKVSAYKNLLLVRGLLTNRILLLCLKKRWNVQYGLHPDRDPIAVPFEAKGVPSEQSEFGHPDVSIIFTCLAFYYTGLTVSQLRQGLQRVLKSDDPAAEYDRWRHGADTLPETLHHWSGINIDDNGQVDELWRHLRLNRNVLDHYMNKFVFPVHAKQFGVKLQASGWDIPLFSLRSPHDSARTTGFSGTNDNKIMLPLTIKQDDLPSLQQTNAEVLTYLLQHRNRQYDVASWDGPGGKRLSEEDLLKRLSDNGIRVLIDAGAYILERDNLSLVKAWQEKDTKAKAAVYFGADNRAWVRYRGKKDSVPLLATPFAENLEDCLVYLDEAHTRGIDLKLPRNARGALTLALGQTKDHTVQAAMRLRLLGSSQSVTFIAPPEVNQSIIDVCRLTQKDVIDSSHVVTWLLEQTCKTIEHSRKLYLAQGADFCRRTNAQWEHNKFLTDYSHREAYLAVVQQPERQSLEQLYGNIVDFKATFSQSLQFPEMRKFMEKLHNQSMEVTSSGYDVPSSALEEVEQERQIEFQVEEVRQVQKPIHYNALSFPGLSTVISKFVSSGRLVGENGYIHVFKALASTSLGQKYDVRGTSTELYVSAEVMRTIKTKKNRPNDSFMRPVEWVLWSCSSNTALIIIPEEAELLIPVLRKIQSPKVHLLAYAAPVTKYMLHFSGLSYYALPSLPVSYKLPQWLSIELGIFAGRLYLDYTECGAVSKYLKVPDPSNMNSSEDNDKNELFAEKPISFLLEWLGLRRKGQDIMHTPMGYICQGRALHSNHSFFVTPRSDIIVPVWVSGKVEELEDDEDMESEDELEDEVEDGVEDEVEDGLESGSEDGLENGFEDGLESRPEDEFGVTSEEYSDTS